MEVIEIQQAEMLQVINRSEVDMQVSTAKQYPRELSKVLNQIATYAKMDVETASECFYVLRRSGSNSGTAIEGLSVRMAEIIAGAWGNLRVQTRIIGNDGKVKITGFCLGAARTARSDLNSQLFDGYSAIEQYGFEGSQGTWTDIYSFGAVLYRTLIGSDPISAKERMSNDRLMVPGRFAEALPAYVINGLINALQILPEDRTRTVEQLRAELSASPTAWSPRR